MRDLERALRDAPLPDEAQSRERARRTVLAAHAHAQAARPRRRVLAPIVWAAVAASVVAIVVTQRDSGLARAFEGFVRDVVEQPAPAPTPVSGLELPAAGRLLVSDGGELWVVERSGRRRELGRWRDATWSPNGLFVAAASGRTLAALDPRDGSVRWRLPRPERVSDPRWAPGGTHVAYRSGNSLRIVYGNGIHDVLAGRRMAAVAVAWRPNAHHTLAWAATDGTVTVEDADTAKVLWSRRGGPVESLAWSADGRRLLVAGRRNAALYDLATGARERLPVDGELLAAAFSPTASRLAVALYSGGQSVVRVGGERVLTAPGRLRDLEWSPDGRWLLAGWPTADHWLLVRTSGQARTSTVSGIRHRFGPDARTHGWVR